MSEPETPVAPKGVELYDPEDVDSYRKRMFDGVQQEISALFPYSQGGVRIELQDLAYDRQENFTPAEEKAARDNGRSLHFRLRGKLAMLDEQTGQKLDAKELTLAQVPYVTPRGAVLLDGREISSSNQARLLPGVYTRRRESGEVESHFNPKAGTSRSQFRVILEPSTAVYRLQVGSSANLHLYSLLNTLGVPDDDLKKAWGPDVFDLNSKKVDGGVLERAYKTLVPEWAKAPGADRAVKIDLVKQALDRAKVHKFVVSTNMPEMLFRKKAGYSTYQAPPQVEFRPDITLHKAASCVWWLYDLDHPSSDFFLDPESFVVKQANLPGGGAYDWLAAYAQGDAPTVNSQWSNLAAELLPKVAAGDPRSAWLMVAHMTDPMRFAQDPEDLRKAMESYRESAAGIEKLAADAASRRLEARKKTEEPKSPEQASAGNYRKGKFSLRGLPIVIETAKGQLRKGVGAGGKAWEVEMQDDYGYISRTESEADGDHVDVFLGPDLASGKVWVVDQLNKDGEFDEHKCMLGFTSEEEATEGYQRNFTDGRKVKHITRLSFADFKDWLELGDTGRPIHEQAFKKKSGEDETKRLMLSVNEANGILEDPILSDVWFGESEEEEQPTEKRALEAPTKFKSWVGIDLDGTLARSEAEFDPESVGDPIPSMLELVGKLRAKGKTVKIFTARASTPEYIPVVEAWLEENGLGGIEVTNIKDPGLRLIIDDRAIGVRRNKGVDDPIIERVLKRALAAEFEHLASIEYV